MKRCLYSVEYNNGQTIETEFFGTNREKALEYLKIQHSVLKQNLKNWVAEQGVNFFSWQNDDEKVTLQLQMTEVEENDKEVFATS